MLTRWVLLLPVRKQCSIIFSRLKANVIWMPISTYSRGLATGSSSDARRAPAEPPGKLHGVVIAPERCYLSAQRSPGFSRFGHFKDFTSAASRYRSRTIAGWRSHHYRPHQLRRVCWWFYPMKNSAYARYWMHRMKNVFRAVPPRFRRKLCQAGLCMVSLVWYRCILWDNRPISAAL